MEWTTKDGQKIPVDQLTDSHLRNIVNYLLRNSPALYQRDLMTGYHAIGFLQGEMALDLMNDELDYLEFEQDPEDYVTSLPIWSALRSEWEKRFPNTPMPGEYP